MVQCMTHEYKGVVYSYEPWEDVEPMECTKIFHDVYEVEFNVDKDCWISSERIGHIPMSPYSFPSKEEFVMWIESERPTREQINKALGTTGNASGPEIRAYYHKWLDNEIDKQLLGIEHG